MSDWISSTVSEVTKYQKAGGTPAATNPTYYGGDIPFVVIEDITKSSRFLEETEKTLSSKGLSNSAAWLIQEPHILYSMYATVGKPIINKISCATNQAIIALKENDLIDQEFLYYQLLFIKPSVYKFTAQTTQSNLNASVVRRLPISYPKDKAYQKKISLVLRTIDRTIAHTEALIQKYQQIKAGLMHDLFTRGIGADGNLRSPRDQAPELYQESAIGWIPKEWSLTTLDLIKESLVDGPFGSNLKTEHYVSDPGVRVVRLQNIQSTKYNDKDRAFVSDKHAKLLLRNKVIGNDVLIAGLGEERYPAGRACLYPEDLPPALNKADCFRFRCIEEEIINGFAMYFFNVSSAKVQVRKYEQGVTRSRINLGNMRRLAIPKPKVDEQILICKRLDELARKIDIEVGEKKKLQKQKSGLMHDLLTGKVQVNVDAAEVACGER